MYPTFLILIMWSLQGYETSALALQSPPADFLMWPKTDWFHSIVGPNLKAFYVFVNLHEEDDEDDEVSNYKV